MDLATLIGVLIGAGLIIIAISMGGSGLWFLNLPSALIVLGGTFGATLINYPLSEVVGVFKVAKNAFLYKAHSPLEIINLMVEYAKKARKEGILSFEAELPNIKDPFLAKGLRLAIDGMESTAIREILSTEIQATLERHNQGAEIFSSMGSYSPAVGMLGTIIGLVQMLMQMKDPSQIGAPMAVALLTTFYGTMLAYLFFLPISGKLKARSKSEVLVKQMIMEGVISIQSGDNYRVVEQKLKAFLPLKERGESKA